MSAGATSAATATASAAAPRPRPTTARTKLPPSTDLKRKRTERQPDLHQWLALRRRTDGKDDGRTEREGPERRTEKNGQSDDPDLIDDVVSKGYPRVIQPIDHRLKRWRNYNGCSQGGVTVDGLSIWGAPHSALKRRVGHQAAITKSARATQSRARPVTFSTSLTRQQSIVERRGHTREKLTDIRI